MISDGDGPPALTRTTIGHSVGNAAQASTEIERFELSCGGLRAVVITAGARLTELWAPDRTGQQDNVIVDTDPTFGDYDGSTVGRFANRIAEGRFNLDGTEYRLATNNGPNHLHGGDFGFSHYVWQHETIETADHVGLRLTLHSPNGDQGYPGAVDIEATYLLTRNAELILEYRATADAPTVLNLTNHAYWNLKGGGLVDDHELSLGADHVLLVDDTQIPIGQPSAVAGTRFDFRSARPIDAAQNDGYDHCFVLDGERPAAVLTEPTSGRRMTVETTQPGVQVYTANHFDPPHSAVALETQGFPDAPNRPDFPSTVLRPGERYDHRTTFLFDVVDPT